MDHCSRAARHNLTDGFPVTRFMLFEQAVANQKPSTTSAVCTTTAWAFQRTKLKRSSLSGRRTTGHAATGWHPCRRAHHKFAQYHEIFQRYRTPQHQDRSRQGGPEAVYDSNTKVFQSKSIVGVIEGVRIQCRDSSDRIIFLRGGVESLLTKHFDLLRLSKLG